MLSCLHSVAGAAGARRFPDVAFRRVMAVPGPAAAPGLRWRSGRGAARGDGLLRAARGRPVPGPARGGAVPGGRAHARGLRRGGVVRGGGRGGALRGGHGLRGWRHAVLGLAAGGVHGWALALARVRGGLRGGGAPWLVRRAGDDAERRRALCATRAGGRVPGLDAGGGVGAGTGLPRRVLPGRVAGGRGRDGLGRTVHGARAGRCGGGGPHRGLRGRPGEHLGGGVRGGGPRAARSLARAGGAGRVRAHLELGPLPAGAGGAAGVRRVRGGGLGRRGRLRGAAPGVARRAGALRPRRTTGGGVARLWHHVVLRGLLLRDAGDGGGAQVGGAGVAARRRRRGVVVRGHGAARAGALGDGQPRHQPGGGGPSLHGGAHLPRTGVERGVGHVVQRGLARQRAVLRPAGRDDVLDGPGGPRAGGGDVDTPEARRRPAPAPR
jgi:hypothetical protein